MQPAVSKIVLSPNQPQVDIENPGKFHDDEVIVYTMLCLVTYCAIDIDRYSGM